MISSMTKSLKAGLILIVVLSVGIGITLFLAVSKTLGIVICLIPPIVIVTFWKISKKRKTNE